MEYTQSEFSAHGVCPWMHKIQYVELLRPKVKSVKLSFGGAIHKGVEAFYGGIENVRDVVETYCDEIRAEALKNGNPIDDSYDLVLRQAGIFIEKYVERYKDDLDLFEIIDIEKKFTVKLSDDVTIAGKIDRIVKERRTGRIFPVETKTAAVWDRDVNRLMLDFQISTYAWAISKILGFKDVTFIYDVIKKPTIRQKKTETPEQYLTRLQEDINDRPDHYLIRDKVTRSSAEIARTELELGNKALAIKTMRENNTFYRNPGDHCFWRCSYMSVCLEDSEDMRKALYYKADTAHEELKTP